MALTYDEKSLIADGKRIWLYSGEIHYFRFPKAEWRRALSVARAAGLNTVATYIAWNLHEKTEGQWNFEGDLDLGAFIDLAKELGLYVMLRPGPYICAEWTGGGIPAWLLSDPLLEQRTDNPVFMEHTEAYLRRVMEIVAPRQLTRGGNVVMIQNDNEYHGGWDERTTSYIRKITEILRENGCEVPINACNCHAPSGKMAINYDAKLVDPHVYQDMIVTYNTCNTMAALPELRAFQPGKPVIVTEMWTGPMVFWYKPVPGGMAPADVVQWVIEFTANQAMVNSYMFIGGTNFGFNAAANIATSYASDYPVGDGILPREKYYNMRPFGQFLDRFGGQVACSSYVDASMGATRACLHTAPMGEFLFAVSDEPMCQVRLDGETRVVRFGTVRGGVFGLGLKIGASTLDYSDLFLLSERDNTVFLWGNAGQSYVASVDGQSAQVEVLLHQAKTLRLGGLTLVILDEFLAQRAWFLSDQVIMGGDMAYETPDGLHFEASPLEDTVYIWKDGALHKEIRAHSKPVCALPPLTQWEKRNPLENCSFASIDAPHFHEKLGALNGYVWYRGTIHSETNRTGALLAACYTNRVVVLVNGRFAGVLGERRIENERFDYENPADMLRERIPVQLRAGENEILLLSEDTGRCCLDSMPLGIEGDVYVDARMVEVENPVYIGQTPIDQATLEYLYSRDVTEIRELDTLEFALDLNPGERMILIVHDAPCQVMVNGEIAPHTHMVRRPWQSFGGANGGSHLWHSYQPVPQPGKNTVRIQYPGQVSTLLGHIQLYVVKESDQISHWSFSALNESIPSEGRCDYVSAAQKQNGLLVPFAPIGVQASAYTPQWFTTRFGKVDSPRPIALTLGKMRKGQIYLNGHNVGRFLTGVTQNRYYLPESWLKEENTLSIFEEYGVNPDGVALTML